MVHLALAAFAAMSLAPHQDAVSAHWRFRAVGNALGTEILLTRGKGPEPGAATQDAEVRVYRGQEPHFAVDPSSMVSVSSVHPPDGPPITADHPLSILGDPGAMPPGATYYYKVQVADKSGTVETAQPEGLGTLARADALSSAATVPFAPLDVVFIGDSITYGANLHPGDPTPCDVCARSLELGPEPREVFFSNEGHSGHTTKDFLPGGRDLTQAESAATKLSAEHPGSLVFSIMLGTNDSADAGPNGSPIDARQLEANLKTIVGTLLRDFPQCKVVLNRALWYSPNTHNGATYEEDGLQRLTSYFPAIHDLPRQFPGHRVFEGDTRAYDYFAATYLTTLNAESGQNGTFYLHPNRAGADALGQLWAAAILRVVG